MEPTTKTSEVLRSCAPAAEAERLAVDLPPSPPVLTVGLARALLAAITSAAMNAGLLERPDDEAVERLAS
jgi:hypothetical protein